MPDPRTLQASRLALTAALLACSTPAALAQETSNPTKLLTITVIGTAEQSLTVPSAEAAKEEIQFTPGAVEVIPDTVFKNGPAQTIRDIAGWVPGVIIQPKSNIDNRVSIRGSGLTRNYGNRGVNLYMDGIPINTSDGLTDVFEIDPTAYQYAEVYKGSNATRYGANSLGGAINFVTPTGRDASVFDARTDIGSFGYLKGQVSSGAASGPVDYFITGSAQREDGFRDHSEGDIERTSLNLGYQINPNVETRIYVNANRWRQDLPGELTKEVALNDPTSADPAFVSQDQQRNIDSIRLASKTTLQFEDTVVDFGVFALDRHVDHPIYRYLDFKNHDYGGFVRAVDDREIGGFRNRLMAGANLHDGRMDYEEFENVGNARKGTLVTSTLDRSENRSLYAENSFYFLPDVAFVAGGQFLHAKRERTDRLLSDGDQSGSRTYDIFSPKVGLLWDVDPSWQVFGNISRSAEVPSFDVNTFSTPASSDVDAQTATTFEIGTRGARPDFTWDVAVYRSELENELQCLRTSPYSPCTVVNADKTIHQGIEIGIGAAVLKSAFDTDDRIWLNAAYSYSDFRFDGDATHGDNDLPGVPPHMLRAELLYKHPAGFYAGPSVDWMPHEFFADNANQLTVDEYAVLNFRAGYDLGNGWSGYVEGRNLTDESYISTTITADSADETSALFNPGYGRAVYAGVRFTW